MTEHQLITAAETAQAVTERKSLIAAFAERYGLEANRMMAILRATVIRPAKDGTEASNEQVASFLVVAHQHNLNPFTKEIHGFLGRQGGIVCVVGVDGWAKKVNEHPQFDGMDFEQDDDKCTCKMYRKDRSHPVVITEYFVECRRDTDPWRTHPKRMLRHKALSQCARLAFSFAGIYDPDEAEAIIAAEEIDVTPAGKISPKRLKELAEGMLEAVKAENGVKLHEIYDALSNDERLALWPHLRPYERSAIKKLLSGTKSLPDGMDRAEWSLTAISTAKDADDLLASWKAIQDLYADADEEVPLDIDTCYQDRKVVLGVPG